MVMNIFLIYIQIDFQVISSESGHMDVYFQLNKCCLSLKLTTMWKICNLLRNVLTQMDSDDNVVLTLSLSSTLNLPQELCCDLITELEY